LYTEFPSEIEKSDELWPKNGVPAAVVWRQLRRQLRAVAVVDTATRFDLYSQENISH
jgi:hypothetical protein